jgi:hypothetical protein
VSALSDHADYPEKDLVLDQPNTSGDPACAVLGRGASLSERRFASSEAGRCLTFPSVTDEQSAASKGAWSEPLLPSDRTATTAERENVGMSELDTLRVASIDEPLAKLNHGRELLDQLEVAARAYIEDHASFAFESIAHPNGGIIARVRKVIDPPIALSLLCGDAVHNVRASLDYLVRQLGIADSHKVSDKSEFPVVLDPGADEQRWKSIAGRTLKLLSPRHVDEIRKLQPFVDLTANSVNVKLQNIDAFERIDKHSLPLLVVASVTSGRLTVTAGLRKVRLTPLVQTPVEFGSEPIDLYWLQGWGKPLRPIEVQSVAGMTVLFGPAKAPARALRDLADVVGGVIGSFALDFRHSGPA